MWKSLFFLLILGLGAYVISQLMPDIKRYLAIRSM